MYPVCDTHTAAYAVGRYHIFGLSKPRINASHVIAHSPSLSFGLRSLRSGCTAPTGSVPATLQWPPAPPPAPPAAAAARGYSATPAAAVPTSPTRPGSTTPPDKNWRPDAHHRA